MLNKYKQWFKSEWLQVSEWSSNVIPITGKPFVGIDYASGIDYTINGFEDENGCWHIQEIAYNEENTQDKDSD